MSNTEPTPPETPDQRPPTPDSGAPRTTGCLTPFLVLVGVILLLPGLCTLVMSGGRPFTDALGSEIATITFSIGILGIVLICVTLGRRR